MIIAEKNSQASDLLVLATETLGDCYNSLRLLGVQHVRKEDFSLDRDYLVSRTNAEGIQFLTTTLPHLGEWFDEWLANPVQPRVEGFKPYNGRFPAFLRPFWIYLSGAGVVVETHLLVRQLRTFLYQFKKLDTGYTREQMDERLETFIKIEDDLSSLYISPSSLTIEAANIMEQLFHDFDRTSIFDRAKHGPGVVADNRKKEFKWIPSLKFTKLHQRFPYYSLFYRHFSVSGEAGSVRARPLLLASRAFAYKNMQESNEPTNKLLFVPKDSRGPRTICAEPAELMYAQQGYSRLLVDYIKQRWETSGHVNFDDQTVNGHLALYGSLSQEWATIDLSDASDRVSLQAVQMLFPKSMFEDLDALRSTHCLLPDGTRLLLEKFATMGSALCFPVESIVFWAICVAAIRLASDGSVNAFDLVYVFGDDIIVPSAYMTEVTEALTYFGLAVNKKKSFGGEHPFRESCGVDAFKGFVVTPYRIKCLPPSRPSCTKALCAYVDYANSSQDQLPRRAEALASLVERQLGYIPCTPYAVPYLAFSWNHWSDRKARLRWNPSLQTMEGRFWYSKTQVRESELDPSLRILAWQPGFNDTWYLPRDGGSAHDVVDRHSTLIRRKWFPVMGAI